MPATMSMNALTNDSKNGILDCCRFQNSTSQMVIVRCVGPNTFFQERVLFPFDEWTFECPPQSRLDIWTHGLSGAELVDSLETSTVSLDAQPAQQGLRAMP
ncbi:MAG: DUF1830 domain-containing protein [Cyanobacteriota bacterium]|nr:DUF1830 domain-containing protein [Cyanobacteriota bacterium]